MEHRLYFANNNISSTNNDSTLQLDNYLVDHCRCFKGWSATPSGNGDDVTGVVRTVDKRTDEA